MTQNRQNSLFDRWYGDKAFFSLAFKKQASPLSFHERLVFSYLVFRTANRGATRLEIAKATRLHRTTVPKVLSSLVIMRLVEDDGNRYLAVQPEHQQWFAWRPDASKPWYKRLYGYRVCHTPAGWTPMQTAVYFCLLTDNVQEGCRIRRSQKKEGIAKMLGLSHDTVERTYKKLGELKLLEYDYLRHPSAEVLALFPDRKKPKTEPWMASKALGWPFAEWRDGPLMANWIDKSAKLLERAGYNKDDIVAYWAQVGQLTGNQKTLYDFLLYWDELYKSVESMHRRSMAEGKYLHARNSLGLLRMETELKIARMKGNRSFVAEAPYFQPAKVRGSDQ